MPKGQRATPSQVQAAIEASRELYRSGKVPPPEKREAGAAAEATAANSFNPEEINPAVAAKGGLTALLHAARQGYIDAAAALIAGGANVNQVSVGEGTSPLLIAVINGQFDMAMFLLERGADPNVAASKDGATAMRCSRARLSPSRRRRFGAITRTTRPLGTTSISSPTAIEPSTSVPVTTVPKPLIVNTRSIGSRGRPESGRRGELSSS